MLDYLEFDGIFRVSLRWSSADIAALVAIWVPPRWGWQYHSERSEGPVGEMLDFGILDAGLFGI